MLNSYNLALIGFGISIIELYKNNQKNNIYVTKQGSVTKCIKLAWTILYIHVTYYTIRTFKVGHGVVNMVPHIHNVGMRAKFTMCKCGHIAVNRYDIVIFGLQSRLLCNTLFHFAFAKH